LAKLGSFYLVAKIFVNLGLKNIFRVVVYRFCKRAGILSLLIGQSSPPNGPFFRKSERQGAVPTGNSAWDESVWWFGFHTSKTSKGAPDWFSSHFDKNIAFDPHEYWTDIDDFSQGDIKDVWELSRFDWVN
jgi:hypothetical protein